MKEEHYESLSFLTPIASAVLYIVGFATDYWIDTEYTSWGLWKKCTKNVSGNGTLDCYDIEPGQSEAYFEVARVVSAFGLLFYLLGLLAVCRCKDKPNKICGFYKPAIFALLGVVLTVTVMSTIGARYSDDGQWTDLNPSLGWSFWVCMASVFPGSLCAAVLFRRGKKEREAKVGEGAKTPCLNPEHYAFFEIAIPFFSCVMYAIAFATTQWIHSANLQYNWGLWQKCNNTIDSDSEENQTNCTSVGAGESDAYFEGARTLSCFALVCFAVCLASSCEKYDTPQKRTNGHIFTPIFIGLFGAILTTIVLIIVGVLFTDDSHWRHLNPKLGWSYKLYCAATGSWYLAIALRFRKGQEVRLERIKAKRESQRPTAGTITRTQVHPVPVSQTNSNSTSVHTNQSNSATDRPSTNRSSPNNQTRLSGNQPVHIDVTPRGLENGEFTTCDSDRTGGSRALSRWPVLTLPRYDLPDLPPSYSTPSSPPPAYEDVVGSGAECSGSAPRPVTPQSAKAPWMKR